MIKECRKLHTVSQQMKFSQIYYLGICLVNALLSRNFCQKVCEYINFRKFHTVFLSNLTLRENFVKSKQTCQFKTKYVKTRFDFTKKKFSNFWLLFDSVFYSIMWIFKSFFLLVFVAAQIKGRKCYRVSFNFDNLGQEIF